MNYTLIKIFLFLGAFSIYYSSIAMPDEANKIITFQGQQKYIMRLLIDGYSDPEHLFSVTPILRKKGDFFEYHYDDDVFNLTEDDFKEIHDGNYVYFDNIAKKVTPLSNGKIVPVSVLFIGVRDEAYCRNLKLTDFIIR